MPNPAELLRRQQQTDPRAGRTEPSREQVAASIAAYLGKQRDRSTVTAAEGDRMRQQHALTQAIHRLGGGPPNPLTQRFGLRGQAPTPAMTPQGINQIATDAAVGLADYFVGAPVEEAGRLGPQAYNVLNALTQGNYAAAASAGAGLLGSGLTASALLPIPGVQGLRGAGTALRASRAGRAVDRVADTARGARAAISDAAQASRPATIRGLDSVTGPAIQQGGMSAKQVAAGALDEVIKAGQSAAKLAKGATYTNLKKQLADTTQFLKGLSRKEQAIRGIAAVGGTAVIGTAYAATGKLSKQDMKNVVDDAMGVGSRDAAEVATIAIAPEGSGLPETLESREAAAQATSDGMQPAESLMPYGENEAKEELETMFAAMGWELGANGVPKFLLAPYQEDLVDNVRGWNNALDEIQSNAAKMREAGWPERDVQAYIIRQENNVNGEHEQNMARTNAEIRQRTEAWNLDVALPIMMQLIDKRNTKIESQEAAAQEAGQPIDLAALVSNMKLTNEANSLQQQASLQSMVESPQWGAAAAQMQQDLNQMVTETPDHYEPREYEADRPMIQALADQLLHTMAAQGPEAADELFNKMLSNRSNTLSRIDDTRSYTVDESNKIFEQVRALLSQIRNGMNYYASGQQQPAG